MAARSVQARHGVALVVLLTGASIGWSILPASAQGSNPPPWNQHRVDDPPASPGTQMFGSAAAMNGSVVAASVLASPSAVALYECGPGGSRHDTTIPAPAGSPGGFGTALDVGRGRLLVGAPSWGAASGGNAYVFDISPSSVQTTTLTGSGATGGYGASVALHFDRAIVGDIGIGGAAAVGSAFVFDRTLVGWVQSARLVGGGSAGNDQAGAGVAVPGNVAAMVSRYEPGAGGTGGAVYVFERDVTGAWSQVARIPAPVAGGGMQDAVSLGAGRLGVASAAGQGGVHVYERSPSGSWLPAATVASPGVTAFGRAIALHGDRMLVGANNSAHVYERGASGWSLLATYVGASSRIANEQLGRAVDLEGQGGIATGPHAGPLAPSRHGRLHDLGAHAAACGAHPGPTHSPTNTSSSSSSTTSSGNTTNTNSSRPPTHTSHPPTNSTGPNPPTSGGGAARWGTNTSYPFPSSSTSSGSTGPPPSGSGSGGPPHSPPPTESGSSATTSAHPSGNATGGAVPGPGGSPSSAAAERSPGLAVAVVMLVLAVIAIRRRLP